MTTKTKDKPTGLALLREPFAPNQISKLPKETRRQIDERKADKSKMVWSCKICGGHHHKDSVHLDYVGHAALTDRLLDADPDWGWEYLAATEQGLPLFDGNGGLWIKLTVCGVTRLGYGSADGKHGGDAVKEIIGDALRNAAMRFGAALDLWHKGDLHGEDEAEASQPANDAPAAPREQPFVTGPAKNKTQLKALARELGHEIMACGDADQLAVFLALDDSKALIEQLKTNLPSWWEGEGDNKGISGLIQQQQDQFRKEAA